MVELVKFDDNNKRHVVEERMSVDDVYSKIDEYSALESYNELSDLTILQRTMKKVCPLSILDFTYVRWIDIQEMCETYGILPFPGSLLEQPQQVFDMLATIMEGKSMYEADYMKELKSNTNKKGGD